MKVKVINRSKNQLPAYETAQSAGLDVKADISEAVTIQPLERAIIPTGLYMELPNGYEMQVRPRSGMAAKYGITVLNSPGTIDANYQGEVKIILANVSNQSYTLEPGERIAQLVIAKYEQLEWCEAEELSQTDRGTGGFGSTGK